MRRDVLTRVADAPGHVALSARGRHLVDDRWLAYVVYYVGGYGGVLGAASELGRGARRYGADLVRDGHYVALGTEMMSRTRHHRSYEVVLRHAAAARPARVLDLGCGSANFLLQLVEATGATFGLGVDSDAEACEHARRNVREAGLEGRVEIVQGDMHTLAERHPALVGRFDVVTAMMVVHESLIRGDERTAGLLRDLAALLTPAGRLIVLDKHTDILEAGAAPPYFTEFKLIHDLTDQDFCTEARWREVFARAGLRLTAVEKLPPHTGSIYLECGRSAETAA